MPKKVDGRDLFRRMKRAVGDLTEEQAAVIADLVCYLRAYGTI